MALLVLVDGGAYMELPLEMILFEVRDVGDTGNHQIHNTAHLTVPFKIQGCWKTDGSRFCSHRPDVLPPIRLVGGKKTGEGECL